MKKWKLVLARREMMIAALVFSQFGKVETNWPGWPDPPTTLMEPPHRKRKKIATLVMEHQSRNCQPAGTATVGRRPSNKLRRWLDPIAVFGRRRLATTKDPIRAKRGKTVANRRWMAARFQCKSRGFGFEFNQTADRTATNGSRWQCANKRRNKKLVAFTVSLTPTGESVLNISDP